MPLRLMQAGSGWMRPLVVVYHYASDFDKRVLLATGDKACVVNYSAEPMKKRYYRVGLNGLESLSAVYKWAQEKVGGTATAFAPVVLVGFSEGCQALRAQVRHAHEDGGQMVDVLVAVDGVHCSKPLPKPYTATYENELQPWIQWLSDADWGGDSQRAAVFTHTEIEPGTYSSVRTTLQAIFNVEFDRGKDKFTPALAKQGSVEVWSFPGKDAEAHKWQARYVLPHAVNRALCLVGELKEGGPEQQALEAFLAKSSGGKLDADGPGKPLPSGKGPGQAGAGAPAWVVGGLVGGAALLVAGGAAYYGWKRRKRDG